MEQTQEQNLRAGYVAKMGAELDALVELGLVAEGNAFCSVLFVGSQPARGSWAQSKVGSALLAACNALGYELGSWAAVQCSASMPPASQVLLVMQPRVVVVYDEAGRRTFGLEQVEAGELTFPLGVPTLYLGDFAQALSQPQDKRTMWIRLQQIKPYVKG